MLDITVQCPPEIIPVQNKKCGDIITSLGIIDEINKTKMIYSSLLLCPPLDLHHKAFIRTNSNHGIAKRITAYPYRDTDQHH